MTRSALYFELGRRTDGQIAKFFGVFGRHTIGSIIRRDDRDLMCVSVEQNLTLTWKVPQFYRLDKAG